MENFRHFDQLRTTELQVRHEGFFNQTYTLTDGQFEYGRLTAVNRFRRDKNIETADGSYTIKTIGWLGKETQIINDATGELIGTIIRNSWDTKVMLTMNNGFNAILTRGPGFFSRQINWTNDQYGDSIKIKSSFNWFVSFHVSYDSGILKTKFPLALITLIGVNIILLRQAQAAAH